MAMYPSQWGKKPAKKAAKTEEAPKPKPKSTSSKKSTSKKES